MKFKLTNLGSQLIGGLGYENNKKCMAINLDNYGSVSIFLSSNGSSWNIASGTGSSLTLNTNTDYYMKRYFTGTQYKLDISTTGDFSGEEVNYITVNSTTSVYSGDIPIILGTWLGGSMTSMQGSIDLTQVYLKVDGNLIWKPETGQIIL